MPRHKISGASRLPEWVKEEKNDCLVSVAEEAYTAKRLAVEDWRADGFPQCEELLRAADKSLFVLNNSKASMEKRSKAGERAARKFWEAKSCARRLTLARR